MSEKKPKIVISGLEELITRGSYTIKSASHTVVDRDGKVIYKKGE